MKKLLGLLLGLLVVGSLFSRDVDSIITIKNSPFFIGYKENKIQLAPITSTPFKFINPQHSTLITRGYQIFKNSETLYIHFTGSGLLYQLQNLTDSLLVFKRIDDTEDYNYNISAFLFTYQKDIYNMGGYGFWKSTGTLRKYNTKDTEWDAEPIKEEIHPPFANHWCWFNPKTKNLYIPYQQIINTGVATENDEEQFDKKVYKFNLDKKEWEKEGKTSSDFFEILSKSKWHIPTEFGHLLSYNNKVYSIDFEENLIKELSSPSFAQTLERINDTYLKYYQNGSIYFLDGKTWKYDSLKIPLNTFEKSNFRVWKKSNTGFAIGIAPIFIILAATAARKRRAKENRNKILTAASTGTPISTVAKIKFNETEKQLLNLLLEKSKQNSTTTITEINYALGIKDKNVGLQKKVRSDVMKSINEKFNFLQEGDTELVCNIRSQADKRFFEYYIEEGNIALLEIMLREENE